MCEGFDPRDKIIIFFVIFFPGELREKYHGRGSRAAAPGRGDVGGGGASTNNIFCIFYSGQLREKYMDGISAAAACAGKVDVGMRVLRWEVDHSFWFQKGYFLDFQRAEGRVGVGGGGYVIKTTLQFILEKVGRKMYT